MNPEELVEQLQALQARLDERDATDKAAKEASDKEAGRKSLMDKFGGMFSNDEDIADLIELGLADSGASVESASEEAVRELILEPLAEQLESMMKAIASAVQDKAEEIIEGPTGELDLNNPETLPQMAPPPPPGGDAGAGLPPGPPAGGDMGMGGPPPEGPPPDMGMPPPGEPPMPPPEGAPMVSDERYKNVRPTILSDARFKTLGTISDHRLKALEKLSGMTELSDEDFKNIIFDAEEKKEEPKPEKAVKKTEVSDATKKDIKPPARFDKRPETSMGDFKAITPKRLNIRPNEELSDATKKDIKPQPVAAPAAAAPSFSQEGPYNFSSKQKKSLAKMIASMGHI